VTIGSVASFAGALDPTRIVPLIWVQPAEGEAVDNRGQGRAALDLQRWTVFVATAAVPDKLYADASFQEAGELMGQVLTALIGWRPEQPGYSAFRYAGRPPPAIELGWAAFPITFECHAPLINIT
jgi:hypothetical protein